MFFDWILHRRPPAKVGCGGSRYVNIFGFNQFGRRNPPTALILSRRYLKDKTQPGPGCYDPNAIKDTYELYIIGKIKVYTKLL